MSEFALPGYTTSPPVAVLVAMKALTEVAPAILDNSVPLPRRVALARTWADFLCLAGGAWCPGDVPEDPRDWDTATLGKVARRVVDFAFDLLRQHIARSTEQAAAGERRRGTRRTTE